MRNLHAFVNDEAKSRMVAIQVQHVEKLGIVQCLDVDPTIIICCIIRHIKRYLQQLHQITWEAKHPVLIPFSLELRDVTRENEYDMNFSSM